MLNPLTTVLLDELVDEQNIVGLASTDDVSVVGSVESNEVTISALVKLDATVFLDVDCCSHRKQDSYDPRINTADKTVVGAINHLLGRADWLDNEIKLLQNNKLDKRTTDGREAAYVVAGTQQVIIQVEVGDAGSTIVKRTPQGQVYTANPTEPRHAANKNYVDIHDEYTLNLAKQYTDEVIIEHTGIQYETLEDLKNG